MPRLERTFEGVGYIQGLQIDPIERYVNLENLLSISHVGGLHHVDRPVEPPRHAGPSFAFHLAIHGAKCVGVELIGLADMGANSLGAKLGGQHAPRREHRGRTRHEHTCKSQ